MLYFDKFSNLVRLQTILLDGCAWRRMWNSSFEFILRQWRYLWLHKAWSEVHLYRLVSDDLVRLRTLQALHWAYCRVSWWFAYSFANACDLLNAPFLCIESASFSPWWKNSEALLSALGLMQNFFSCILFLPPLSAFSLIVPERLLLHQLAHTLCYQLDRPAWFQQPETASSASFQSFGGRNRVFPAYDIILYLCSISLDISSSRGFLLTVQLCRNLTILQAWKAILWGARYTQQLGIWSSFWNSYWGHETP